MVLVAIAYVLHKAPFVFPIVGGRKPEQLLANVEALEISLTAEQIAYLDAAKPVDLGFPGFLIVSRPPIPPSLCFGREVWMLERSLALSLLGEGPD